VRSCLIICFGMGTSFRSAVSWHTDTTAVELVPSVPKAFGFYHADADVVRANPNARIVIDDGRRFLARTRQKFDVIVIDPPPPLEAAGSSLLYSREFYEMIKSRLAPHGIVQGWLSEGRTDTEQAIYRSFRESFPFVECFLALNYNGVHMLGSLEPISVGATDELIKAMPLSARDDLLEWSESRDLAADLDTVLGRIVIESTLLNPDASVRITDDRPYNEYFLLRQFFPSRR